MSPVSAAPSRRPSALRSAIPAVIGFVVLAALGAVAGTIGDANLRAAEHERLASSVSLVVGYAPSIAGDQRGESSKVLGDVAAFDPANPAANQALLQQFMTGTTGDRPTLAALYTLDGRPVAASPDRRGIGVALFGAAWPAAVGGQPGPSPAFYHDGALANATLVPVARPGEAPWAVMAIITDATSSARQEMFTQLVMSDGGLELVDPNGVVLSSWNAAHLGQHLLDPGTVRDLPAGSERTWTLVRDGTETTLVGTSLPSGYALVFTQETGKLYGDLRGAETDRDRTLLAVLGGALAGLVTFQVARDRAARRTEARTRALLANSGDLVLVTGAGGRLTFVSPAINALLGHRSHDWEGRSLTEFAHPDDVERLTAPAAGSLLDVRLRTSVGAHEWFDIEASDLRHVREVGGILLTCHAVGERKRMQDELGHQATHDALTNLPNRGELSAQLDRLVTGGRPIRPIAFLYIDLDGFKPVNDTFGHDAGDGVLQVVAERLRGAAGPAGFICRLGGDEFGVVVEGGDEAEARDMAERLRRAAREPVANGATLVRIDATIGIAVTDPSVMVGNPERLVRQADQAMVAAKQAGGGRIEVAPPLGPEPEATTAARRPDPAPVPSGADEPGPGPGPAPAAPDQPVTPIRRRSRHLRNAAPLLVAAGIVVSIAAVGSAQTRASQQAAEERRIREYQAVAARTADFYSRQSDPARILEIVAGLPWTFDGSPLDAAIAKGYGEVFAQGQAGWDVTLATTDGRMLAAHPQGTALSFAPGSAMWRAVTVEHRASADYLHEVDGQLRSYFVMPVIRGGQVRAVLTVSLGAVESFMQGLMERNAPFTNGGWTLLDEDGRVVGAWDRGLVGQQLARPEDLAPTGFGDVPPSIADHTGRVVIASLVATASSPGTVHLSFVQPTEDFFRDLRVGQDVRDLSLLVVVLVAVAGLGLFNHRREQAVRRSEQRLDALLQHSHDIVVVFDAEGNTRFVSSATTALLGHDPTARLGRPVFDLVHPDDQPRLAAAQAAHRANTSITIPDIRVRDHAGRYRWFDIVAADLLDDPDVEGIVLTCHEIGERKAVQDQLAYRAEHDALTGLPNRSAFAARLEALSTGEDRRQLAILFIDLDHFKPVNDTLGHDAGDEVLRTVADRLVTSVRSGEESRPADIVCRLGGDEFAVLLADVTEDRARSTAERIIGAIAEPVAVAGTAVTVGATIGIALSHPDDEHPDTAVRHADLAMYRAKDAGRGRYWLASPEPR